MLVGLKRFLFEKRPEKTCKLALPCVSGIMRCEGGRGGGVCAMSMCVSLHSPVYLFIYVKKQAAREVRTVIEQQMTFASLSSIHVA